MGTSRPLSGLATRAGRVTDTLHVYARRCHIPRNVHIQQLGAGGGIGRNPHILNLGTPRLSRNIAENAKIAGLLDAFARASGGGGGPEEAPIYTALPRRLTSIRIGIVGWIPNPAN